jgi:hypothetical protein
VLCFVKARYNIAGRSGGIAMPSVVTAKQGGARRGSVLYR